MQDAGLRRLVAAMMARRGRADAGAAARRRPRAPTSAALLERFANPALRHRTWQIAMDGSQKLPQRLLGTIRDRLAQGRPIDRLALGVAAWMRYVTGIDEQGRPIDVRDPLSARLRAIADQAGLVAGFLTVREVFGDDLPREQRFVDAVTAGLRSLFERGASATVADWTAG